MSEKDERFERFLKALKSNLDEVMVDFQVYEDVRLDVFLEGSQRAEIRGLGGLRWWGEAEG